MKTWSKKWQINITSDCREPWPQNTQVETNTFLECLGIKKKSVLNFSYTYLFKGELTEIECKINL